MALGPGTGAAAAARAGRGRGTRTPGLRFWRPSLYQLSYTLQASSDIARLGLQQGPAYHPAGPKRLAKGSRAAALGGAPGKAHLTAGALRTAARSTSAGSTSARACAPPDLLPTPTGSSGALRSAVRVLRRCRSFCLFCLFRRFGRAGVRGRRGREPSPASSRAPASSAGSAAAWWRGGRRRGSHLSRLWDAGHPRNGTQNSPPTFSVFPPPQAETLADCCAPTSALCPLSAPRPLRAPG